MEDVVTTAQRRLSRGRYLSMRSCLNEWLPTAVITDQRGNLLQELAPVDGGWGTPPLSSEWGRDAVAHYQTLLGELATTFCAVRRQACPPNVVDAELVAFPRPALAGLDHPGRRNEAEASDQVFTLADAPIREGTPYLAWSVFPRHGWGLFLRGVGDGLYGRSPHAFADWNDRLGMERLVALLHDEDAVSALASLTDAAAFRRARQVRVFTDLVDCEDRHSDRVIDALRNHLIAEGLGSRCRDHGHGLHEVFIRDARDNYLGVAAVTINPVWCPAAYQRGEIERERQEVASDATRAAWLAEVPALVAPLGWRVVEMPHPRSLYANSTEPLLWFTRFSETEWEQIRELAEGSLPALKLEYILEFFAPPGMCSPHR